MKLSVAEVRDAVSGKALTGAPSKAQAIRGVSTDTRTLVQGDLFIALEGATFDGHAFVKSAFDRGAAAAIVSEKPDGSIEFMDRLILVEDTVRALGDLANHWITSLGTKVIGVTGTNGKTTTKDLIFEVLSTKFNVCRSKGNFNNLIGLPLSALSCGREHELAVFEMGISEPGEMSRLCEIAPPTYGLITNISGGHLAGLGSVEVVAREKGRLFESLPPDGTAVVNKDDERVNDQSSRAECEKITFGTSQNCDIEGSWNVEDGFPSLRLNGGEAVYRLRIPGENGARNALAAVAVASCFGVNGDQTGRALTSYEPPPGRGRVLELNGIRIIDDTYNANPVSMREAINILKSFNSSRRIAVVGEMLELGDEHQRAHEELGEHIGRLSIDYVLACGPTADLVTASAQSHGIREGRAYAFADDKEALASKLIQVAQEGSVVLVKGSRGNQMEDVIELLRLNLAKQSL